jgi:phosphatidylserine/phosphatidylglycerophosphate/cardiolipin synthase-like enzyme
MVVVMLASGSGGIIGGTRSPKRGSLEILVQNACDLVDINVSMDGLIAEKVLSVKSTARSDVELVIDAKHFQKIILEGICAARVSVDISTADFKAMLVPLGARRAESIVSVLRKLARKGIEIRVMHAGVPSSAALLELKKGLPTNMSIRRCPRLHAKAVVIDARAMYLGSANLTGAGLGAKADGRRNFEWGIWTSSAEMIEGVLDQFNTLWQGQHCESCKRRDVCPVPLEEPGS